MAEMDASVAEDSKVLVEGQDECKTVDVSDLNAALHVGSTGVAVMWTGPADIEVQLSLSGYFTYTWSTQEDTRVVRALPGNLNVVEFPGLTPETAYAVRLVSVTQGEKKKQVFPFTTLSIVQELERRDAVEVLRSAAYRLTIRNLRERLALNTISDNANCAQVNVLQSENNKLQHALQGSEKQIGWMRVEMLNRETALMGKETRIKQLLEQVEGLETSKQDLCRATIDLDIQIEAAEQEVQELKTKVKKQAGVIDHLKEEVKRNQAVHGTQEYEHKEPTGEAESDERKTLMVSLENMNTHLEAATSALKRAKSKRNAAQSKSRRMKTKLRAAQAEAEELRVATTEMAVLHRTQIEAATEEKKALVQSNMELQNEVAKLMDMVAQLKTRSAKAKATAEASAQRRLTVARAHDATRRAMRHDKQMTALRKSFRRLREFTMVPVSNWEDPDEAVELQKVARAKALAKHRYTRMRMAADKAAHIAAQTVDAAVQATAHPSPLSVNRVSKAGSGRSVADMVVAGRAKAAASHRCTRKLIARDKTAFMKARKLKVRGEGSGGEEFKGNDASDVDCFYHQLMQHRHTQSRTHCDDEEVDGCVSATACCSTVTTPSVQDVVVATNGVRNELAALRKELKLARIMSKAPASLDGIVNDVQDCIVKAYERGCEDMDRKFARLIPGVLMNHDKKAHAARQVEKLEARGTYMLIQNDEDQGAPVLVVDSDGGEVDPCLRMFPWVDDDGAGVGSELDDDIFL